MFLRAIICLGFKGRHKWLAPPLAPSRPAITVKLISEVRRFYFDHNATTPVSQSVLEVLVAALLEVPGNASSIHQDGQLAKQSLEAARRETALLLGCEPKELVFTSGGTEADNLAIFGSLEANSSPHKHIITTAIEHPAVLNPYRELERSGLAVTYIRPGPDGLIDPDDIRRALKPETVLVSVMHANNETGTLQPIAEIAAVLRETGAHEAGALLHSDGVQAAGKIPIDVEALGVDLYSISGHKFYAPKGIGALYVKNGTKLRPIQFGGKHERERRPGTENVPSAVAMGKAAAIAHSALPIEPARLGALRDRLETGILACVPDSGVNGRGLARTPNTTNIYFDGLEGEALVISLDLKGFAVSSGSACSSGAVEPSHVLLAMGLAPERARASLRFSLGASNNEEQVDALIDAVAESAAQLRKLSPTYTSA
jgi:cysteine desulfurase